MTRTARLHSFVVLGLLVAFGGLAGAGCATVHPTERQHLSDPAMRFDEDPVEKGRLDRHHDYREGSTGGTGVRGGGCGCG
jgi:hypothetical protein